MEKRSFIEWPRFNQPIVTDKAGFRELIYFSGLALVDDTRRSLIMRSRSIIASLLLTLSLGGCSWSDCILPTIVGIFPDAYSGGGTSVYEKQAHLGQTLDDADSARWR
jgi:hypothetical protein